MPKAPVTRYRVVRGLNYPSPAAPGGEARAEPGAVITDLPAHLAAAEVRAGTITAEPDAPATEAV